VISREEAERLRDQLQAVLAEDAHNTQRLLARLDSISQESGIGAHAALLLILTSLGFDEAEARGHWEAILAHREQLVRRLGRDAGVRVAILDYFTNVNRRLAQPTLIDLEMQPATASAEGLDPLTGLATDRRFRTLLQTELRRARRYDERTCVALFDVDEFSVVNREVGRLVGDRLLRELAMLLSNNIRDIDVGARPGEDELALLLPATGRNGAILVAERFRREVEAHFSRRESAGRPLELRVSGGVACYPDDATDPEALLQHAAQALYEAKAGGRNRVQAYHPERRSFLRFELEPGRFEIEVLAQGARPAASARNLSRSGILLTCPERLEVGEEIELRLVASGSEPAPRAVRLRGRVVRLEELAADAGPGGTEDDRFEVGVALDLEAPSGSGDLLEFLEATQSRIQGDRR
jgi:diguanylate cyclase (GGDEF)-like protein